MTTSTERPRAAASTGAVDAGRLKAVFRRHPAGVAVVTYRAPAGPAGFTATSVISVSADPALVAFSVASGSSARSALESADAVVIHLLADDQAWLAERFAERGAARFAGVDWMPLPTGEPLLTAPRAWLRGRVVHRVPAGDSLLVVVEVTAAVPLTDGSPLVHVNRSYRTLGPTIRTPGEARVPRHEGRP